MKKFWIVLDDLMHTKNKRGQTRPSFFGLLVWVSLIVIGLIVLVWTVINIITFIANISNPRTQFVLSTLCVVFLGASIFWLIIRSED